MLSLSQIVLEEFARLLEAAVRDNVREAIENNPVARAATWCVPTPHPPIHSVDYRPFIKSQLAQEAVNFKDLFFVMQIWSRHR